MKTTLPQFVLGYHGCDLSLVKQLLSAETQLNFSKNTYDWLGHGIYFWENAPFRAMEWAIECAKNPKMTKGKASPEPRFATGKTAFLSLIGISPLLC